jgi:UTP--glucose-1-phosphate uridylyltransferase
MIPKIRSAVVPAAGLGTRLRPLTKAIPKEMLPVGRRPVLEHVLLELKTAGIERVALIVSPQKQIIRSYFEDGADWGISIDYILQPQMKGLGEAVQRCREWTQDEPFLVAFGDCMLRTDCENPTHRLLAAHQQKAADTTLLVEHVPLEKVSRYGICDPENPIADNPAEPFRLKGFVEKPSPHLAPSRFALAARIVVGQGIFSALTRTPARQDGELGLAEAVAVWLHEGASVWAVPMHPGESRLDIGGLDTYLAAATVEAMRDTEFGEAVRRAAALELEKR